MEEGSSKAEQEVKEKSKEKCKGTGKDKGKRRERANKKEPNLVKLNLIGGKTFSICKQTM